MFPHEEAARRSTAEATFIAISLLSRYGAEMIAYRACMNPSMYFALCPLPLASCMWELLRHTLIKKGLDSRMIGTVSRELPENQPLPRNGWATWRLGSGLFVKSGSSAGSSAMLWDSDRMRWQAWQPCEVDWVDTSYPYPEQQDQSWLFVGNKNFCIMLMEAANHSSMTGVKIGWSGSLIPYW